MANGVFDAVYGCLIGGAIGEAMGAPVENWHHEDIRETHGKDDGFVPYERGVTTSGVPGEITDDSVLRHYLCLAIVGKGGRITPDDYAKVWLEDANPERLFFTERIVLEKLWLGMSSWETGRGQLLANAAITSIAPIGIINAANPAQAYQVAFCVASVHQDGLERDAAATVAAGFAAAFAPGATVEGILAAMEGHATQEVRRLLASALDLARASGTPDSFAEAFTPRCSTAPSRCRRGKYGTGDALRRRPAARCCPRWSVSSACATGTPAAASWKGRASAGTPTR